MNDGGYESHRQVRLRHPSGSRIRVDAGLAPLLRLLWKVGIHTVMSCESMPLPGVLPEDSADRYVWIMFRLGDFDSANGFATVGSGRANEFANWAWEAIPEWGAQHVEFHISVRFPVEQLDEIVERFRTYPGPPNRPVDLSTA